MQNHDRLINLLSTHWQQHKPKMYQQFQQENRLQEELEATAKQFDDLMYELTEVKKMGYQAAWEITAHQFLLPEEEESSLTSQSQNPQPPAISE